MVSVCERERKEYSVCVCVCDREYVYTRVCALLNYNENEPHFFVGCRDMCVSDPR